MDYPIWDIAMGGGTLMAIVAIAHVIVAHFAIGGGLVIVTAEALSVRRGDRELRELARRGSLLLIFVSTVFGAISGVGIWVVAGLISPGAISSLIHTYVWGWAMEWVFFIVEIVAALVYYTTWGKISRAAHLMVGWLYVVSAYMSLVIINGIITFMATPGRWLETAGFWDGFFNPTYWPSLVLRTGVAMFLAAAFMTLLLSRSSGDSRPRLARYLGLWLVAGTALAYAGYRWWEAALPETLRAQFLGDAAALPGLAATRSMTLWALALLLALGLVVLVVVPRAARTASGIVLMLVAFAAFGGYERLREGVRKPFLIHSHMFSNGLLVDDIPAVNEGGVLVRSKWGAHLAGDGADAVARGRQVFRAQCASCHTIDGYQGIRATLPTVEDAIAVASDDAERSIEAFQRECRRCHPEYTAEEMRDMLPSAEEIREDPEMIRGLNEAMISSFVYRLRNIGEQYTSAPRGRMIDTHQTPHPYMAPAVGTDDEMDALAAYLTSLMAPDQDTTDQVASLGGGR
mgnify:CR=1 FL=1